MRALTPWTGMTNLRKEMERLFEHFGEPGWMEVSSLGEWVPKIDVSETKDAMVVKAEAPGVDQKDIAVSLQDGVLTIRSRARCCHPPSPLLGARGRPRRF